MAGSRQGTDSHHRQTKRAIHEDGSNKSPGNSACLANVSALSKATPGTACLTRTQILQWSWAPSNLRDLMAFYERRATDSYLGASPQADHLISLSRLNIWHAANDNIVAAGMTTEHLWADDSISIFSVASPDIAKPPVPASLRPTALQMTVPHHPWFDVFPFPNMRDNFLRGEIDFDEEELCHDLIGFWDSCRSDATLLVWGLPCDPLNWEVTEAFARKWSWTLRGCPEILKSTNRWRAWRGEKPLIWRDILFCA